jgi:ATP-binding cassette subfamily C protein CydD
MQGGGDIKAEKTSPPLDIRILQGGRAKAAFVAVALLEALQAAFLVLSALQIGEVFQDVVIDHKIATALQATWLFALFFGLRLVIVKAADVVSLRYGAYVAERFRSRLLSSAKDSDISESELGFLSTDGLSYVVTYVQRLVPSLTASFTVTPLLILFVFFHGVLYFVEILVGLAVLPVLMIVIGQATKDKAAQKLEATVSLNALYLDTLRGVGVLNSFNKAELQVKSISRSASELKKTTLSVLQIAFASGVALDTLVSIVVAIVAVSIGIRLNDGGLSLGAGAAVLFVTPEIFLPIRTAALQFHASQDAVAVLDRIDSHDPNNSLTFFGKGSSQACLDKLDPLVGRVAIPYLVFDSFGFEVPERSIYVDLTTSLEIGEWLGVTGASGSGKTSFLRAITGEIPFHGRLRLAGSDGDLHNILQEIAYLPSRPGFFDGTLRENLSLYRGDCSEKEIHEALELVELSYMKFRLWDRVLPSGVNFSSGERQRLALARVILSRRSLVLLDEPTSHLDPKVEAEVVRVLREATKESVTVVVTHSPHVASECDQVVVFSEGKCHLRS